MGSCTSDEDDDITALRSTLLHSIRESRKKSKAKSLIYDTDIDDLDALRQAALGSVKSNNCNVNQFDSVPVQSCVHLTHWHCSQFPTPPPQYRPRFFAPGPRPVSNRFRSLQRSNLIVLTQSTSPSEKLSNSLNLSLPQNANLTNGNKIEVKRTDKWSRNRDSPDESESDEEKTAEKAESDSEMEPAVIQSGILEVDGAEVEKKSLTEEAGNNNSIGMEEDEIIWGDEFMDDDLLLSEDIDDEVMKAAAANVSGKGFEIIYSGPPRQETDKNESKERLTQKKASAETRRLPERERRRRNERRQRSPKRMNRNRSREKYESKRGHSGERRRSGPKEERRKAERIRKPHSGRWMVSIRETGVDPALVVEASNLGIYG